MAAKTFTVRLSPEDAHRAEVVARVDGISVNEVFRLALESYLAQKRADAEFVERARAMIARDAALIEELA